MTVSAHTSANASTSDADAARRLGRTDVRIGSQSRGGRIKVVSQNPLDEEQAARLRALPMSLRAQRVRDYILAHGSVTTADIAAMGYEHPPRAVRDLRDAGAVLKTVMIVNSDGKRMASYRFTGQIGDDGGGRVSIPKVFSDELKRRFDFMCAICGGSFEGRQLQADHRVPFAIAGDPSDFVYADFMPLCASCNRAKSWSCEHCDNWESRDASVCHGCFWAHPTDYTHVGMVDERRLSLVFQGVSERETYDRLGEAALYQSASLNDYVKEILRQASKTTF